MPDNAREIFGKNLSELLERTGKSQIDVCSKLNVATGTVSSWVNGQKFPRIDKLQALADYLGVKMSILTEENGLEIYATEVMERRLLDAWRGASEEIKSAALTMLEDSAAKKKDTEASAI